MATVPGSVGSMAAAPLAAVNSVDLIVRYKWPSWDVHDGMFMAFSLRASWKLSRDVKLGASVAEEMRGMSASGVRNSATMLSMLD